MIDHNKEDLHVNMKDQFHIKNLKAQKINDHQVRRKDHRKKHQLKVKADRFVHAANHPEGTGDHQVQINNHPLDHLLYPILIVHHVRKADHFHSVDHVHRAGHFHGIDHVHSADHDHGVDHGVEVTDQCILLNHHLRGIEVSITFSPDWYTF